MRRRNFLQFCVNLPFLGLLKPKEDVLTVEKAEKTKEYLEKRSGTQFIKMGKCNCSEIRLMVYKNEIWAVCPHYEPYRINDYLREQRHFPGTVGIDSSGRKYIYVYSKIITKEGHFI